MACSDPKAYDSKTANGENTNTANGHVIYRSNGLPEIKIPAPCDPKSKKPKAQSRVIAVIPVAIPQ